MRVALSLSIVLASFVLASSAQAHSGTLTRTDADASWSRGSIAGSVTISGCAGAPCSWIPIATVQPALPSYYCRGDEALDSDPDTRVVWNAGVQSTEGTIPFDVPDTPILSGVQGQRVCLSLIEQFKRQDPVCIAQAPILGYDPSTCPLVTAYAGYVLASALLSVPASAPPASSPA